jgi:hypothetical protein
MTTYSTAVIQRQSNQRKKHCQLSQKYYHLQISSLQKSLNSCNQKLWRFTLNLKNKMQNKFLLKLRHSLLLYEATIDSSY